MYPWLEVLLCLLFDVRLVTSLVCDHLKYEYYHGQAKFCKHCDKCIVGEGKLPYKKGMDLKFGPHGATRCIPCRPCPWGQYSDRRSHDCDRCTNCSAFVLTETRACTPTHNAECGATRRPVLRTKNAVVPTSFTTTGPFTEKTNDTHGYMIGSAVGVAGALALIGVILGIICFVYRIGRKRRNRASTTPPCTYSGRVGYVQVPPHPDTEGVAGRSANRTGSDEVDTLLRLPTRDSLETINEEFNDHPSEHSARHHKPKIENRPLMPKRRRHHSCSTDYGTSHVYDNHAEDTSENENMVLPPKPRFDRQMSFPMSNQESSRLTDKIINESNTPPSIKFCSYISKLTMGDESHIYKTIAKDNGMTEEAIKMVIDTYSMKGWQEVVYNVFIALRENNVTKKAIYQSLRKSECFDYVNKLQTYERQLEFDQNQS